MGGDTTFSHNSSTEVESSVDQEVPERSPDLPALFNEEALGSKVESGSTNGEIGLVFEEFGDMCFRNSSDSLAFKANRRLICNAYAEVLSSYEDLQRRSVHLEEGKSKILSYTPGSWIEEVGGLKLGDYNVPETTSLLLVGPKGSGKSNLVNKISRVFESDKFSSERAQVSYNSSVGGGTYFLQEYTIPRGSNSFCLYDTRSLSDDLMENMEMLKRWMTKGVHHGELVKRASDDADLKSRMKCKVRQTGHPYWKVRMVNFVIMVVNGLSVLESMDCDDEAKKQYTEMIATAFRSPFLSFKDDKPVIVVTHGDLLTLPDRARVRVHLGERLGIPPKTQIFDIPESNDSATQLTMVDLLHHCLEHADRNLPFKSSFMGKMDMSQPGHLLLFMVLGIGIIVLFMGVYLYRLSDRPAPLDTPINWNAIRHLWLDLD